MAAQQVEGRRSWLSRLNPRWLATKLFHIHTLHGFFNLDTWLTAIIGAAILLLIYHLFTSRSGTSTGRRRTRRYARR